MTRFSRGLAVLQALVYLTSASTIVVFRASWHASHEVVDSRLVETHVGWLTAVACVLLFGAWRAELVMTRSLGVAASAALVVVNVHQFVTDAPAAVFVGDLVLQAAILAAWLATFGRS